VTRRGSTFNAVNIQPRPTPAFAPPIWIGGGSDRAVTRAAEYGDGWTPYLAAPNTASHRNEAAVASMDELRIKIAQIHEARAKAGRGGTFDIALAPLHRLAANTREQADLYIESLSALTEAGVTWAMVSLGHESRAQFIENVQWFGEEVIGRGA
jgi:alkanesulfonate monooxygenase SsuD/methylene tetrahydromethanopterin reductase-like flavin-dependent oxidoreductase (luciferase family)